MANLTGRQKAKLDSMATIFEQFSGQENPTPHPNNWRKWAEDLRSILEEVSIQ
jgi:hypothetical protein